MWAIRLANGMIVRALVTEKAELIEIEGRKLSGRIRLPAMFVDGPEVIGVTFLQLCRLVLDGPKKDAMLELAED
jgi:hypothetical protein